MKTSAYLSVLLLASAASAVTPEASSFGPPGNPDDQIRAFWHPSESFYTNLFDNGFNTLIVCHAGEYNIDLDRCPHPDTPVRRNRWLDICRERGVGFVEKLAFKGKKWTELYPLRTKAGIAKGCVDPSNPSYLSAHRRGLAKVLERMPDHPAVFGIQPSSEVRDHSVPADTPEFRAAYRKATGCDIPPGAESRSPKLYTDIPDFPIGRVLDSDYPLLRFYRWWWREGDGWNRYQTEHARQFAEHFSHPVASFYDPIVRTPPIWGSGGDVTFGNQWTYPYPQPYKVLHVVSEQQAMARGNPGQGVTTMIQGISYRSAIAPKEETPAVHPKWHDEFPNTKYPTTPAALMREAIWSALARKIDGIMFFAGAALFDLSAEAKDYDEYRKRTYYQYCDPETMPVVNAMMNEVAVPLGPLLRAIPERPMEVAVLESASAALFARTGTWGGGSDIAVAALSAGLQCQTLYDEDVARDGIPASLKVLMLPRCPVMEATTVKAIRDWQVRTDGVVMADGELVPAILPDFSLPALKAPPEGVANANAYRACGREIANRLASRYRPYAAATDWIIPYVRTFRDADYVFAINDRRGYGDYVGAWKKVLDRGLPNKGVVRVDRAAGAVYDLVRHVAVPFAVKGGVTEIPVEYETNDGRLLMLTSRPLRALTVRAENGVVTVTSPDRDVMIPIEICRTGKRPYYAVVRDGVFSRNLDGTEGLAVRNLATGEACSPEAKETVFFIGCHPDDIENCLGLMLRMRGKYDIQVIDFTRGEGGCGPEGYTNGTTAVKRIAEEREVCKTFGCEPVFLTQINYRGRAYAEPYVTAEIEKLLLERKPKAVFVNWPIDGHPDHVQCAAATMHAVWNVKRDHKFLTELYFYEEPPGEGQNFNCLCYYVDVSAQIDEACELCRKWACQHGDRIAAKKRIRLAKHGATAPKPVPFAEVYTTFMGDEIPGGVLEEFAISKEMKPVTWNPDMYWWYRGEFGPKEPKRR